MRLPPEGIVKRLNLWLMICGLMMGIGQANAQGWHQIYPSWEANANHDLIHWKGDTVFACGNEWTLLRSIDAGKSWEEMFDYSNGKHLRTIQTDGNVLFLQARRDRDTTTGLGYLPIYAFNPYTSSVREIRVPRGGVESYPDDNYYMQYMDSTFMFLEGNDGQSWLHSSGNRGENWTSLILPAHLWVPRRNGYFQSVAFHFISRTTGIIVTADSSDKQNRFIYRTSDAGATWIRLPGTFPHDPVCIEHFQTGETLVAVLSIGLRVWKSTDSCATWTETSAIPWNSGGNSGIIDIAVKSADMWYIIGAKSDTYLTTDGGLSWASIKEPARQGGTGEKSSAILAMKSDNIIISNELAHFFLSEDGGLTWATIREPLFRIIRAVTFRDPNHGVVSAYNRNNDYAAFATSDGGATWQETLVLIDPSIFDSVRVGLGTWLVTGPDTIQFYQYESIVSGIKSSIYRLSSLGTKLTLLKSWELGTAPIGAYSSTGTMHFIKGNTGTAYSYDDGTSWGFASVTDILNTQSRILFNSSGDRISYCANKNISDLGFAYAPIFRSMDSCKTWERRDLPITGSEIIWDLDVLGPNEVIFCTGGISSGKMFRTTDGGLTWALMAEVPPSLSNARYLPPAAYRFEFPGLTIVKTEDLWQTKSLQLVFRGISSGSAQTYFLDANHGWVGQNFIIFRTSTGGVDWIEQPGIINEGASITSIYPNPVSTQGAATVEYTLPVSANISLTLYNALGQEVRRMEKRMEPGAHIERINTAGLAPGIYYYTLLAGSHRETKMVVVR